MFRSAIVIASTLLTSVSALAEFTFTKDVAPVLAEKCVRCHQPGSVAPMSLLTYEETRPWAKSIRTAIADGAMPPWRPDPAHGQWQHDISLTQAQRDTLIAWVDGGAKRGPGEDAPLVTGPAPEWELGEPDFVINLPRIDLPATGDDIFPTFIVEADIGADRWVQAAEFAPGDRKVLHHILMFLGEAPMGASEYDVRTTTRSSGPSELFSVWVAGAPPVEYPEGMGRTLARNQVITFQTHYHLSGEKTNDATRLGLHFGEGEMQKKVTTSFGVNLGIVIPPGDANYTETAFHLFDQDSQIVSMMPHAHVRAKSAKYTAVYPDGRREILLNVPHYDYNWQWAYQPVDPLIVPAGTKVEVEIAYDNSANNPRNPDPSQTLYYREQTLEEMFVGFMESVPVEGVRPRPMNPLQKVTTLLAAHPAEDSYINDGLMGLPWGAYMPRDADAGKWYISVGPVMFTSNLWNLRWEGDAFSFDSTMVNQGGGGTSMRVEGTQSETGELQGTIRIGVMEHEADASKRVMTLPFKGKRPAATGD